MNAELKNRTLVNEAVVKKGMTRDIRSQHLLLDGMLAIICSLSCMLYFGLQFPDFLSIAAVLLFILGVALAVLSFTLPRKVVRINVRRIREQFQADSYELTYTFSDDAIQFQSSLMANPTQLSYDSVKKILLCDDLILLKSKAKLVYFVDRKGFENGDEGDFRILMSKKCPKAVPREYRC